jgi:hypothetical protein
MFRAFAFAFASGAAMPRRAPKATAAPAARVVVNVRLLMFIAASFDRGQQPQGIHVSRDQPAWAKLFEASHLSP